MLRGAVAIPTLRPNRLAMCDPITPSIYVLQHSNGSFPIVRVIPMLSRILWVVSEDIKKGSGLDHRRWQLLFQNVRPYAKR
jgi:hypothetical protein